MKEFFSSERCLHSNVTHVDDNASELQYARCAMFSEQITKCKDISLEKFGYIKIRSTYMGDVDGSRTLRAESHKLVCNNLRLIRLDLGLRGRPWSRRKF